MRECINGTCEITESADFVEIKPLPAPTASDLSSLLFNEIWKVLHGKRLECPQYYTGWQIATGRHVKLIVDMLKEANG